MNKEVAAGNLPKLKKLLSLQTKQHSSQPFHKLVKCASQKVQQNNPPLIPNLTNALSGSQVDLNFDQESESESAIEDQFKINNLSVYNHNNDFGIGAPVEIPSNKIFKEYYAPDPNGSQAVIDQRIGQEFAPIDEIDLLQMDVILYCNYWLKEINFRRGFLLKGDISVILVSIIY